MARPAETRALPRNAPAPASYTPGGTSENGAEDPRSPEELMEAYGKGDVEAFEALFWRFRDRVYGYFARTLGRPDRAAELFQQTFLRLHQARRRYDPSRPLAAWLFSIAANLRKDELKRATRRPGDDASAAPPGDLVGSDDPEQALLDAERRRALERALARLPDSQREVIVLHRVEGLSLVDVAEALGERVEAVKSRAFRGYRALQRILGEEWRP